MIVVDVETSGMSPELNSILSIGALDLANPSNQFYIECDPWAGAQIQPEAMLVNGIDVNNLGLGKRSDYSTAIKKFIDWLRPISDRTLAGHNTGFDRSFLESAAVRSGIDWRFGYRTIDLHSVAYVQMLKRGLKPPVKEGRTDLDSDKIHKYVGLPDEPKPHIAINGAKWEAEAFSRLIYGKNLLPEFKKYKIPDYLQ